MERRLIDANALKEVFEEDGHLSGYIEEFIDDCPTIDAVEVVHCRECAYFRGKHVLTHDGQRKSYSEFPPEAFGGLDDTYVTSSYGINVGSQCLVDCDSGYGEDKTVFRQPNDYCSRGERRANDENAP